MELAFDHFALNFLRKDRFTARKLFFQIHTGHAHVGIFGTTGIPSDLCLCVSFEKYDPAGFQAALHQAMQSLSKITWQVRGDRND